MIITNRRGDIFLDFLPGTEPVIPGRDSHIPLTHALAVVRHQGKVLFIFNTRKQKWELPGGMIDAGETPYQCAVRELFEETNQHLADLTFRGLMKFRLQPDQRLEFGALYSGELPAVVPFIANDEADKIALWDLVTDIGYVDEIDRKIVDFG